MYTKNDSPLLKLSYEEAMDLLPAINAGVWLKKHGAGPHGEDLYIHRNDINKPFVVSSPGGSIIKTFESLPDAWCFFTGRTNNCPKCKGTGTLGDETVGYPTSICPVCAQFGKITVEHAIELRLHRSLVRSESLFRGGE